MDRRIKYTHMVLEDALIQLLESKPIARITVKELCHLADVNRATFYNHFKNPSDLLQHIHEKIMHNVCLCIKDYSPKQDYHGSILLMTKLFEYIKENAHICKVLLGDNGDRKFPFMIFDIIKEQIVPHWNFSQGNDKEKLSYIYNFTFYGALGLIKTWLKSDTNLPPTQMANLIYRLAQNGITAFVINPK